MTTDLEQYRGRRGGQTKVSRDRLTKFIGYVREGLTLGAASKAIGIGEQTRIGWMRRGRLELVRLSDADIDPFEIIDPTASGWPTEQDWHQTPAPFDVYEWPFVVFCVAVEKALATFEANQLAVIRRAAVGTANAPGTWQAAAWLLERRFPELYGRAEARLKQQVDVTVVARDGSEPVSVDDLENELRAVQEQDRRAAG